MYIGLTLLKPPYPPSPPLGAQYLASPRVAAALSGLSLLGDNLDGSERVCV